MTPVSVLPYTEAKSSDWDTFCVNASNATFLHTRRFLSHHGSRFEDASVCIVSEGRIVGVMPAARDPSDSSTVTSHPGITYGGLIATEWLTGARFLTAFDAVAQHYMKKGFTRLVYKVVPHIYHRRPAQDDLYALQRMGARRYRTDLAAVIDLADRGTVSMRRLRGLRKAKTDGIIVEAGGVYLGKFWRVLADNLASRHSLCPVHSQEEVGSLMECMPNNISLRVALVEDEVMAGVVLFDSLRVRHCQYIGTTEVGRRKGGLDAVFDHCIQEATQCGLRFFSFGISTEAQGRVMNEGLHTFKSEFGASGIVHEFYEMSLA